MEVTKATGIFISLHNYLNNLANTDDRLETGLDTKITKSCGAVIIMIYRKKGNLS